MVPLHAKRRNPPCACFHAIMPSGSTLKSVAELMVRCAPQTSTVVDENGIAFVSCDPSSGRLIKVHIQTADMSNFKFMGPVPLRCTLESTSLHAVFHQLKRRDQVVLYGTLDGQFGSLVDYSAQGWHTCGMHAILSSGRQTHTKHSTICVKHIGQCTEYIAPEGYKSEGVVVPSTILQRILREYKNISKRIILTGNSSYIHIQTDARMATTSPGEVMATPWFSLHRSDKLGMVLFFICGANQIKEHAEQHGGTKQLDGCMRRTNRKCPIFTQSNTSLV